jgi:hypothetical protein
VKGEIRRLKDTINTMVDQLNGFSAEVTRVAREVGTEGKLGGQAQVRRRVGVWKELTENVNSMASNLTAQVRNIAKRDWSRRPYTSSTFYMLLSSLTLLTLIYYHLYIFPILYFLLFSYSFSFPIFISFLHLHHHYHSYSHLLFFDFSFTSTLFYLFSIHLPTS